MVRTLLIYGFNGSPDSQYCQMLKKWLPSDKFDVRCYEYPQGDCRKSLASIESIIASEKIDLVIGISLGGFVTLALKTDRKRIVINPCMRPSVELPKLTPRPDHSNDSLPSKDMIESYKSLERQVNRKNLDNANVMGFFALDDELFGLKYLKGFVEKWGSATPIPGGHGGCEEAMPQVVECIIDFVSEGWSERFEVSWKKGRGRCCRSTYEGDGALPF